MSAPDRVPIDLAGLPANTHEGFAELARLLRELAGDDALALHAVGGWLHDDPLYAGTAARSAVTLKRFDLPLLDRIAARGTRLGKLGLAAPLVVTPDYLPNAADVFPLEFLEIQQLHVLVFGSDSFADLKLAPANLRLQCERELRSELIGLRQGLLSAAGKRSLLGPLCRTSAERVARILRGLLTLVGRQPPRHAAELVAAAAEVCQRPLQALERATRQA